MTEQELNRVRDLNKHAKDMENHLNALRLSAQNITPLLDGMPHSTEIKNRVEKLALNILDYEEKLSALRREIVTAGDELSLFFQREVNDLQERTILFLRYVVCMRFRDIASQVDKSEPRVFQIHHDALSKIIVNYS